MKPRFSRQPVGRSVMYYIQSISNNNNISMQARAPKPNGNGKNQSSSFFKKLKQKILNIVPDKTFKDTNLDQKKGVTEKVSRPHWNRAIMGVTAVSQPVIDHYNPWVDEDTREVSTNKTIAKICVGTATGIIIRKLVYELVNYMTNENGKTKLQKFLLPLKLTPKESGKAVEHLKHYKSTISSFIAILIMLFTNFKIDAPLTAYYTNKLNAKKMEKIEQEMIKENTPDKKGLSTYV